jgi:hypothetical protein
VAELRKIKTRKNRKKIKENKRKVERVCANFVQQYEKIEIEKERKK